MTKNDNSIKPIYFLLHGWGGSTESLKKLEELFKLSGDLVHNLEYPGFGNLKEIDEAMNLDDYADYLSKKIQELNTGHRPVVLVGHSFGGKIILKLLSRQNISVFKTFIVNASGIKPKLSFKSIIFKRMTILKFLLKNSLVRKLFYKLIVRESDYVKTSGKLKETFKNVINEHLDDKLKQIQSDVVIIWGENDKVTPLYMAKKLKSEIINSKLYIIKGASHSLPLKQPEEVFKIIQSEINKVNY